MLTADYRLLAGTFSTLIEAPMQAGSAEAGMEIRAIFAAAESHLDHSALSRIAADQLANADDAPRRLHRWIQVPQLARHPLLRFQP